MSELVFEQSRWRNYSSFGILCYYVKLDESNDTATHMKARVFTTRPASSASDQLRKTSFVIAGDIIIIHVTDPNPKDRGG